MMIVMHLISLGSMSIRMDLSLIVVAANLMVTLFCIVLGVARFRTTTIWLALVDLLGVRISKFALIPLQNSNSMCAQRVGAQMVHSVASVRYVAYKAMPNPTVQGTIHKLRLCLARYF